MVVWIDLFLKRRENFLSYGELTLFFRLLPMAGFYLVLAHDFILTFSREIFNPFSITGIGFFLFQGNRMIQTL